MHQIIDVLLSKLGSTSGDRPADLRPWFKGFRGDVTLTGTSCITSGIGEVDEHDDSIVRITELPIGRWTDDYKAALVTLMDKGIVQGFKEYHSVTDVEFVVKLTPEGVHALHDSSVDVLFKLRRSFPMGNVSGVCWPMLHSMIVAVLSPLPHASTTPALLYR